MLTSENAMPFIVSNDTAFLCEILRKASPECRVDILQKIPSESYDYLFEIALEHEHYEVCQVIKDIRETNVLE